MIFLFNFLLMTFVTYRVYINFTEGLYASAFISGCIALGLFFSAFSHSPKWRFRGECLMIATLIASLIRLTVY